MGTCTNVLCTQFVKEMDLQIFKDILYLYLNKHDTVM